MEDAKLTCKMAEQIHISTNGLASVNQPDDKTREVAKLV